MTTTPPDRSHIATEQQNQETMNLHLQSVAELVATINREDRTIAAAVGEASASITRLIEAAEPGFISGGRLVYLGAGTSGRLGVLDASEAPPTFCVEPGRVVGIMAGGDSALRLSSEGKEDDPNGAREDLVRLRLTQVDTVIAIAAGGTTPYALGALELAKGMAPGLVTGFLCCTPIETPSACDHLISVNTGPEVITGSTRMKAGTATKLVLNTISTALMVREGRVFGNLMVDLRATNDKLRDRAARILTMATGIDRSRAFAVLAEAGGEVKTAIIMIRGRLHVSASRNLLARHSGRLDNALHEIQKHN